MRRGLFDCLKTGWQPWRQKRGADKDYWGIVLDPHFDRLCDCSRDEAAFEDSFRAFPEPVRHLFAIHMCCCEVSNGGFHQFFFNSTGLWAPTATAGFRAIGLTGTVAILEEAMAMFGANYPMNTDECRRRLVELGIDWDDEPKYIDDLNTRFYAIHPLGGNPELSAAGDAYARAFLQRDTS